jgi:hypothetical protein
MSVIKYEIWDFNGSESSDCGLSYGTMQYFPSEEHDYYKLNFRCSVTKSM